MAVVKDVAYLNAKQAKKVTNLYGVTAASNSIPQGNMPLLDEDDNVQVNAESESEEGVTKSDAEIEVSEQSSHYPEPDSHLQLKILSDITQTIEENPSINIVLEMVLEGLYRGVGMDRSLFAILSKDHKLITCKYELGADSARLCEDFTIDISHSSNIFNQVVQSKKAAHIPADPKQLSGTLNRDVLTLLGPPPYLIMPTIVRQKVIGVYLADRNASERPIEYSDFVSFQQFCKQANMGLTFLSMQG